MGKNRINKKLGSFSHLKIQAVHKSTMRISRGKVFGAQDCHLKMLHYHSK
jgi:hypothetical protein